jgi:RNA polymerase sigma-B factor
VRSSCTATTDSLQSLGTAELWARQRAAPVREELLRRNLPLAHRLAGHYRSQNEPLDDLVQIASVGLLLAIDRFDPGRGVPFHSYAIPTIRGELKRHFRDNGWVLRVPRATQERALRVESASRQLAERMGRSPRIDELAERLHLSIEEVIDGLQAGNAHFGSSLDAPAGGELDSPPLVETIGSEDDGYALIDAKIDLLAALRRLPYLERQVMTLRLRQELKQSEIAAQLGCSQMQVSRLLARATSRLQHTK